MTHSNTRPPVKWHTTWRVRAALLGGLVLGIFILIWFTAWFLKQARLVQYVQPATNFIFATTSTIKATDDRTNILILGRGGDGHEAPDLTDTIIVVSVSHKDPKVSMISLPRDIWVDSLQAKINTGYYWGKQKATPKEGLSMAKQVVSDVIGQPIHYGIVLDFGAFTKMIDALGGVDVTVEHTFTDHKYPIAGKETDQCNGDKTFACRYETISFVEGVQTMDGTTALKFARSRYAEGDEGTDFARAARQQKVIEGIKNKILSTNLLFNPDKIGQLIDIGEKSVETDISKDEGAVLARLGFEAKDHISHFILDEPYLIHPPISPKYGNQYVLTPRKGDFSEVKEWVKSILP